VKTEKKLADALQKISQLQTNDLGEGIVKLADSLRAVEFKHETLSRSLSDDLINSLQKSSKPEESELAQFENDYKKARDATRAQIAKLETNSKKAGKKGPEALKQSIAVLNDKIKEAEQIKADKLRTVLLLERKKYCNFLSQWLPVISSEVDLCNELSKFRENEQYWRTLATSNLQLPAASEELIKANQERTFVSIQGGGDQSAYSESYDYSSSYDDGYSQSNSYPSQTQSYNNSYSSGGMGTATALYDFAGEQNEDLPFYAGDLLTITKEDDGSGWLTGELNGRSGIFPSSYVQRN